MGSAECGVQSNDILSCDFGFVEEILVFPSLNPTRSTKMIISFDTHSDWKLTEMKLTEILEVVSSFLSFGPHRGDGLLPSSAQQWSSQANSKKLKWSGPIQVQAAGTEMPCFSQLMYSALMLQQMPRFPFRTAITKAPVSASGSWASWSLIGWNFVHGNIWTSDATVRGILFLAHVFCF